MIEKQINQLIKENIDSESYSKYILVCSVKDFKTLQRLMKDKYDIKEFDGKTQSMWKHYYEGSLPKTIGTVIFKYANFELNVIRREKYTGEPMFRKITTDVNYKTFWNSKKI